VSRRKKKKGERYIDRWLKEHKRISLYLKNKEYNRLMSIADSKNMGIKEFILSLVDGFSKYYSEIYDNAFDEAYQKGFNDGYEVALSNFLRSPDTFYQEIMDKYKVESALFSVPCEACKNLTIVSHTHPDWDKIKKFLYKQFVTHKFRHGCCQEVIKGKRASCEHMKRPGQ
jgi:hypothetical protein